MKLFLTILVAIIFEYVHGILPLTELQPVDAQAPEFELEPVDSIVCTMEYLICPSGKERIVNGCQQSCVPCGEVSLPLCPKGYTAKLSPPAENICPSYTCVPVLIRPPIRPPIEPVAY